MAMGRNVLAAAVLSAVILSAAAVSLAGDSLSGLILRASDLPKGWGFARGNYTVSATASDFYSNYTTTYAERAGASPVDKEFQSILGGPDRANVFYLLFPDESEAMRVMLFAQNLIWEGPAPSAAHPERIFSQGALLAIVSSADKGVLDRLEKAVRTRARKS